METDSFTVVAATTGSLALVLFLMFSAVVLALDALNLLDMARLNIRNILAASQNGERLSKRVPDDVGVKICEKMVGSS